VEGDRRDPLWRMYPERWLESLVFKDVAAIDPRLNAAHIYSQVPAFSASDRAMIDILTCTHDGRLAVLELKADEDINLPLQGLDYWARVRWHHARGEFQPHGYFTGVVLSPRPPLLILVAPSMRVHPSTDIILSYFSPQIEWSVVGLDERLARGCEGYIQEEIRKKRENYEQSTNDNVMATNVFSLPLGVETALPRGFATDDLVNTHLCSRKYVPS